MTGLGFYISVEAETQNFGNHGMLRVSEVRKNSLALLGRSKDGASKRTLNLKKRLNMEVNND